MAGHQFLTIRKAEPGDTATILSFIRDLADYEKLLHEVVADEESLQATLFGPNPSAFVFIAELGEDPAGFALYHSMYSTFIARPGIYLEDLYVTVDLRGKGIGKALLKRLAEIAVERGCGRVEWAVLDWNEPAIQFYQSIGAAPMAEWQTYRLAGSALRSFADD